MSSSEDSDIDIECQRIIKPKKLITRIFNLISLDETSTESESHIKSQQESKSKSKKTKTDASCQDKAAINSGNKFARRLPIALNMLGQGRQQRNKHFNIETSKPMYQQRSSSGNGSLTKRDKKGAKIKFLDEESDKWEETMQLIEGIGQKTEPKDKISKTCRRPQLKQNTLETSNERNDYKQKTTPLFSAHRNRTLIKEYYTDGSRIRTNWLRGTINGYTQIDYEDKGKFKGIFQQGEMISGQLTFPNGFVFTGQFSMFAFHGFGKLKFPTGQVFQGNWMYGSLQGIGKIIYPKGQIYYGQISNFKRDGQGYLYFTNGHKYVGEFADGQITGYGQYHNDGIITKKGFWFNGKFLGNNQKVYRQKKQEVQSQKKKSRKISKKSNEAQSIYQSLEQIKSIHENMKSGLKTKTLMSEVQVLDVNENQSSSFFQVSKQRSQSNLNRVIKQISFSLKVI